MRLKTLYDRLDAGTTPASVLLPWLPTPAMIKKLLATRDIYNIVTKAIHERKASGKAREDTLQMLLDHEDDELMVVGVSVYFRKLSVLLTVVYSLSWDY